MQRLLPFITCALVAACVTTQAPPPRAVSAPYAVAAQGPAQAPFGDAVPAAIVNYSRVAPYAATAGRLGEGGVAEAKALGFSLVVDLRQPTEEGVAEEAAEAASLGLNYIGLPLAADETALEQIAILEDLLADPANFPALIHCASANRAAAAWTLLRARAGVEPVTAVEEGRAAGLMSREKMVRELLGVGGET